MPITRITSAAPSAGSRDSGRAGREPPNARLRAARSSGPRTRLAARAAERAVSGRRAPGIATSAGESWSSQASATSACVAPRASAISASGPPRRARVPARRGPPSGEWAITAIPSSVHRSTTAPRRARSSWTLNATSTAATGTSSSASSSWRRLTFDRPTRRASPSSRSRASARIEVDHDVRGSGAWNRNRSIARPSNAARLASQSAKIALARPLGTQPPPARVMPPFVTTREVSTAPQRRSAAASNRSLRPRSASPRP